MLDYLNPSSPLVVLPPPHCEFFAAIFDSRTSFRYYINPSISPIRSFLLETTFLSRERTRLFFIITSHFLKHVSIPPMSYSINPKPEPLGSWSANVLNTKKTTSSKQKSPKPLLPFGLRFAESSIAAVTPANLAVNGSDADSAALPLRLDSAVKKDVAQTTPSAPNLDYKGKPSACVFVASLLASKSDVELCKSVTDHFEGYGKIANVKVLRDYNSRPYAFVQYTNDDDSKLAIKCSNNSLLDGRYIRCEPAKVNRTLFITSYEAVVKGEVAQVVKKFGETELVVASNGYGQIKSGQADDDACRFWFVKFCYRDDAIRAFASLTDNSQFNVEWAKNVEDQSTHGRFDKYTIFIGQLSRIVTEADVEAHFSKRGKVRTTSVVHKPTTSYAFVTFEDEASAASAVAKDNHTMFMEKNINVQYRELSSYPKMILSSDMPVVLAPPPVHSKFKTAARAKHNESYPGFNNKGDIVNPRGNLAFRSRTTPLFDRHRREWDHGADSKGSWPRSRYGTGASEDDENYGQGNKYYLLAYEE